MKKSTIITVLCFALGIIVLAAGFILLTDNNISNKLFSTTTTTTTTGGGGGDNPEYKPMDFFSEDVSQYITLGQYKGIEIEVDMLEVSDETIDMQLHQLLVTEDKFTKNFTGTVTEGTVFNIDYTGYLDGVAFKGGNDVDVEAYILNGEFYLIDGTPFIEGFAEGIMGRNAGEEFDINATFPDEYAQNESLAGKTVVFKIKINYIAETEEPSDEWVAEFTDDAYKTLAEFKQYFKDSINPEIEKANVSALWDKICNAATVIEIPEQQSDYYYNVYKEQIEYYALYSAYFFGKSMTYEEVRAYMGYETEDDLKEYAKETVKTELVLYAIMQAEGIQATDDELEALIAELMESESKTREEIIEKYSEEDMRKDIMVEKTEKFVEDNNSFVLKTEDAE